MLVGVLSECCLFYAQCARRNRFNTWRSNDTTTKPTPPDILCDHVGQILDICYTRSFFSYVLFYLRCIRFRTNPFILCKDSISITFPCFAMLFNFEMFGYGMLCFIVTKFHHFCINIQLSFMAFLLLSCSTVWLQFRSDDYFEGRAPPTSYPYEQASPILQPCTGQSYGFSELTNSGGSMDILGIITLYNHFSF